MSVFFMFGKYTADSTKEISAARTGKARKVIEDLGGRVTDIYAFGRVRLGDDRRATEYG